MILKCDRILCRILHNITALRSIRHLALTYAVVVPASLLICTSPHAQSAFVLSGFGGTGKTLYAYNGLIIPLAGTLDQTGPIARLWAKTYKFSYQASLTPATSTRIDATGWGVSGEFGYQWNFDTLRIAGFAGLDYRHHTLTPNDPGSKLKNRLGAILSLDGTYRLSKTLGLDANSNISFAYKEVWLQARPYYRLASGVKFGPDLAYISGPDFAFTHLGLYGSGFKFTQKWLGKFYLGAEAGVQFDQNRRRYDPYGGMHMSFFF